MTVKVNKMLNGMVYQILNLFEKPRFGVSRRPPSVAIIKQQLLSWLDVPASEENNSRHVLHSHQLRLQVEVFARVVEQSAETSGLR